MISCVDKSNILRNPRLGVRAREAIYSFLITEDGEGVTET